MNYRLFLIWKADTNRGEYIPVGRLDFEDGLYSFQYVNGVYRALEADFSLIPEFPEENKVYRSKYLFPLFENRLMSRSRQSLTEYLESMALHSPDEIMYELARSGGRKATDRYRIIGMPELVNGNLRLVFFAVGLTRLPISEQNESVLKSLHVGQRLLLTHQAQNLHDSNAIMLHTEENIHVGWIPQYYASELTGLLKEHPEQVRCEILRINYPAIDFAPDILLVEVIAKNPENWKPFQKKEFQLASNQRDETIAS